MLGKKDQLTLHSSQGDNLKEKVVISVKKWDYQIDNCGLLQHRTWKQIHSLLIMGFTDIKHLIGKVQQNVDKIFSNQQDIIIEIFDHNLEWLDDKIFSSFIENIRKKQW